MKYVVTHTLNADELEPHIAKIGGLKNVTIDIVHESQGATRAAPPKLKIGMKVSGTGLPNGAKVVGMTRKPRDGSTVNSTVLSAMASGPVSTAVLKDALTAASKKASSLPTAIAALQKSGEIERVGKGQYQLGYASRSRNGGGSASLATE